MILDDGGDLTNMVIDHPELVAGIKGLSEETTTEYRLYERVKANITNAGYQR
jgi:adenosylhomocysteinase